eukprot:EG_transcript_3755
MGHKYTKIADGGPPPASAACLYLGSIDWLIEDEVLDEFHVGAIVSVLPDRPQYVAEVLAKHGIAEDDYMVYPLEDSATEYISLFCSPSILDACHFIHEKRLGGKTVLVHCDAGITRSATVVVAYLMCYGDALDRPQTLSVDAAAAIVRGLRERVDICSFLAELRQLQGVLARKAPLPAVEYSPSSSPAGPSPRSPKSWSQVQQEGDPVVELSVLRATWAGIRALDGGEAAFGRAVLEHIFALGGPHMAVVFAGVDLQQLSRVMACMLRRIVWCLDAKNLAKLIRFHRHIDLRTSDLQAFHDAFMLALRERLAPPAEALQSWDRFLHVLFSRWAKAVGQPALAEAAAAPAGPAMALCPVVVPRSPKTPKLALPPRRTR